jgi:hypothetical protein
MWIYPIMWMRASGLVSLCKDIDGGGSKRWTWRPGEQATGCIVQRSGEVRALFGEPILNLKGEQPWDYLVHLISIN